MRSFCTLKMVEAQMDFNGCVELSPRSTYNKGAIYVGRMKRQDMHVMMNP
jgi:hypothetical protein